jgi:hypothetical protein
MFGIEVCMLKIIIRKATCFGVEINHNHVLCFCVIPQVSELFAIKIVIIEFGQ